MRTLSLRHGLVAIATVMAVVACSLTQFILPVDDSPARMTGGSGGSIHHP